MMSSPSITNFKSEIERVLQRRDELIRLCYDTPDVEPNDLLTAEIVSINQTVLASLRGQILAASNIAKGEEKHELLELLGQIDGAMSGIGIFEDLDVSESRLDELKKQLAVMKSHREAKRIANEIRRIEWALSEFKKQKEARAQDQPTHEKIESEIQRVDGLLYGHLENRH